MFLEDLVLLELGLVVAFSLYLIKFLLLELGSLSLVLNFFLSVLHASHQLVLRLQNSLLALVHGLTLLSGYAAALGIHLLLPLLSLLTLISQHRIKLKLSLLLELLGLLLFLDHLAHGVHLGLLLKGPDALLGVHIM